MTEKIELSDVSDYELEIEKVYEQLERLQREERIVSDSEGLEKLEQGIRRLTDRLGSLLLGKKIQEALDSSEGEEAEKELVKRIPKRLKSEGKKAVHIETSFGYQITVWVRYYRRNCDRKRKKRHAGLYAGLVWLGIYERCTPHFSAEVGVLAAMLGSFDEAQQVLTARGVEIGSKSIRRITYRSAQRARMVQHLEEVEVEMGDVSTGRRIIASADGGRVRLRENKRGRKTKKGRTRYKGAWREPKLFIIYVVDAEGKKMKKCAPLIDGTLHGPDVLFSLLLSYLRQLNIQASDVLLFVADGAKWIWNRVPALAEALGLKSNQLFELIDFFHAVQHLHTVSKLRKDWSPTRRKRWLTRQRKRLLLGQVDQVMAAIRSLCRGRNSKAIRTHLNYFVSHQHRMAYDKITALKLPIGSGAIESAIRRVVNLRLKGPAIFWCKGHAEELLMLRSFYKSGQWHLFKKMAHSPLAAIASLA
ncbi:MAG: hypothetical protein GY927_01040 [bacterium]|nr:hypothetical protein [bacterium]